MRQTTLWGILTCMLGLLLLGACNDASSPPPPPAAGVAQGKPTLLFFYTDN